MINDTTFRTFRFEVVVGESNDIDYAAYDSDSASSNVSEAGMTTTSIVVVTIVVILILVIIVGGGITYWARKNEKCCFQNRGVARPGDPKLEAPLNQDDPSMNPIIRAAPRP